MAEVEQILGELREDNISVEELEQKVKRATELLAQCRERLTCVEQSVEQLFKAEE